MNELDLDAIDELLGISSKPQVDARDFVRSNTFEPGIGLNLVGYEPEPELQWEMPTEFTLEVWEALIADSSTGNKPKHVFCGVPTLTKEEHIWREENYDKSNWVETFPCEFCGCCPTPGQCVRSVTCPRCWRMAGTSCMRDSTSTVIAPYHIERWELVRETYGTWYSN